MYVYDAVYSVSVIFAIKIYLLLLIHFSSSLGNNVALFTTHSLRVIYDGETLQYLREQSIFEADPWGV